MSDTRLSEAVGRVEPAEAVGTPRIAPPAAASAEPFHLLLDLGDEAADRLHRDAATLLKPVRRGVTRTLRQVIWDTDDRAILGAGLALGLQTIGRRRTQVLRDLRRAGNGRAARVYDSALDREGFDLSRLAFLPGVAPGLAGGLVAGMLMPVFGLDIARTTWTLADGAAVTLDRVTLDCATGRETFALLDLAAPAEAAGRVYDLAGALLPAIDLALASGDALQRGYWRLTGARPAHAADAGLDGAMTVRAGLMAIGQSAANRIRQQFEALAGGLDAVAIHQTRVALRRLRSVLAVLRDALPPAGRRGLGRRLGDLAQQLGAVREWDVLLEGTIDPLAEALGPDPIMEQLRDAARRRRDHAGQRLAQRMATPDLRLLSLELDRWFGAGIWPDVPTEEEAALLALPLGAAARTLLKRRHRKLIAGADVASDAEGLHRLRIEAKKLRYTAELLRPLFSAKATRAYLVPLRDLQEVLGAANDANVARQLIPLLLPADEPAGARALGLVTGWTAAETRVARARFTGVMREFAKAPRFWK